MATPALSLIEKAWPHSEISVICRHINYEIFNRSKYSAIIDPRSYNRTKGTFELIWLLKKEKFDIGFLFSNTFLDALCFRLGGIKIICGYKNEARSFLLDHKLEINRGRHYINRYAHLVNSFLDYPFQQLPPVTIPFQAEKTVVQKKEGALVGFYFGGVNKKTKHYPNEMAIQVLETLSCKRKCLCVLLGDKTEQETSDKLVALLSPNCHYINLTGKTSILELVDTIASLDLLVTVDSSPMHIASAVGTPFVALIGKCPNPFSAVRPKIAFGHYVESLGQYIEDGDQMKDLFPEKIIEKILELIPME